MITSFNSKLTTIKSKATNIQIAFDKFLFVSSKMTLLHSFEYVREKDLAMVKITIASDNSFASLKTKHTKD